MTDTTYKLVEACSGTGDVLRDGELLGRVGYRVNRYQAMMPGSGLPIPNLHRIEGSIEADRPPLPDAMTGDVTLRLEDGRTVRVAVGCDGTLYAEGHGPGRGCSCC